MMFKLETRLNIIELEKTDTKTEPNSLEGELDSLKAKFRRHQGEIETTAAQHKAYVQKAKQSKLNLDVLGPARDEYLHLDKLAQAHETVRAE